MASVLRRLSRPLRDGATYRRWTFLVLGGALLVPYVIFANALGVLIDGTGTGNALAWTVMAAATLTALVATASVPAVRVVMVTGAVELLRGPLTGVTPAPAHTWPDRWRTSAWLLAHVLVGGVVSVLSLAVPVAAVMALIAAFAGPDLLREAFGAGLPAQWRSPWAPVVAVLAVVALLYAVAGAGALLARLGPALLGPSAEQRLAAAERRAADLAARNRLARELHDSVGHALSIVTVQAAAAGRVLARDPAFAGQALRAIETQARMALEDLDHVLGLLREDAATVPQPTLTDLDRLVADTRAAGMDLSVTVGGDIGALPRVVSREAYRIVQECLTNALRHGQGAAVTLTVAVGDGRLRIAVANPLPRGAGQRRPAADGVARGGRGLRGIDERLAVLGGAMTVSDEDGRWVVSVHVPLDGSDAGPSAAHAAAQTRATAQPGSRVRAPASEPAGGDQAEAQQ